MCFKGQSIHGYIRPLNLIGSKVTKKFTIKLHMRLLSYFINFITFLSIFHIEILTKTRRIGLMSSNHRLNLFSKLNDDSPNNSLFSEKMTFQQCLVRGQPMQQTPQMPLLLRQSYLQV